MWLYEEKHCCIMKNIFKTFVFFRVFLSVFIVEIFNKCLQCTVYFLAVWNCQNKANRTFSIGPLVLWTWSIVDLSSLNLLMPDLSMPDLSSPIVRLRTFSFLTYCRCTVFFYQKQLRVDPALVLGQEYCWKFILKTYQTAKPKLTWNAPSLLTKRLNWKGQCHEIFYFRYFSWISFPQTLGIPLGRLKNSRKFSQLKVHH